MIDSCLRTNFPPQRLGTSDRVSGQRAWRQAPCKIERDLLIGRGQTIQRLCGGECSGLNSREIRLRNFMTDLQISLTLLTLEQLIICISRHQNHNYANEEQSVSNFNLICKMSCHAFLSNFKAFGLVVGEL